MYPLMFSKYGHHVFYTYQMRLDNTRYTGLTTDERPHVYTVRFEFVLSICTDTYRIWMNVHTFL